MQEITSYAGCLVPIAAGEGQKVELKGRNVNDTDIIYTGDVQSNRLVPRRLLAYCNTYTSMNRDSSMHMWFKGSGIALIATGEQKECTVLARLNGKEVTAEAHAGVFLSCEGLSGAQELELTVLSGSLLLDRAVLLGRGADITMIGGANGAYVYSSCGFERDGFGITGKAGERAEIYCMGPSAAVTFDGLGRVCMRFEDKERFANIDCERTMHLDGLDRDGFNRINIEILQGSITIKSVALSNTTTVVSSMNARTDAELADMHAGKRTSVPQDKWHSVSRLKLAQKVALGDGVLKKCFDRNITYLKNSLKLPRWVDAKDQDRIWIDMLVASNEGRMLVGMGNTLRFKEVPEFRKAVEEMLDEVERRQFTNGDGYCLPYESSLFALSKDTWPGIMRDEIKNYDRTMFTKGMLAAGYAGFEEVWPILRKFYDWYNNCEYLPGMLLGSMGVQGSAAGPLVCQSPAGVPQDIITNMKFYDMDWWLEYLAKEIPEAIWRFTLNRPHNYLLTSLCALFDIYALTGEEKYLKACMGGYKIYRDYFQLPGSFITICEHFECRPWTHKISNVPNSIFETCAGVFWVDLTSRLLSIFPDCEEYALQMEQSIFNLVCSCQGDDGKIRYFNQLNGQKYPALRYNTCCEIQGTGFIGQLPQFIYMLGDSFVQVNLFAESSVDFDIDGNKITLEQHTSFPYGDTVRLKVKGSGKFSVRLRIPSWSVKTALTVAGQACECCAGSYASIDRQWRDGDEIILKTARELTFVKYDGENRTEYPRYAVMYGPVMMCVKGAPQDKCMQNSAEEVALLPFAHEDMVPRLKKEAPLMFSIEGTEYKLVPYASFTDDSVFTCFPAFKE